MAVVTIYNDLGTPKNKVYHCFHCFSRRLQWNDLTGAMIFVFWRLSFKPPFSPSLSFIQRLLNSSSLSVIRVVSSVYLRLWTFLPEILIPICASSNPVCHMMYCAYKLNKQADNIQAWRTPFPIWNQSFVTCPVLTVASWHAYRFLRGQVKWSVTSVSKHFPQFDVTHTKT